MQGLGSKKPLGLAELQQVIAIGIVEIDDAHDRHAGTFERARLATLGSGALRGAIAEEMGEKGQLFVMRAADETRQDDLRSCECDRVPSMRLGAAGRANLVPDAHLAALAVEHGLVLTSTDGGFARFSGLRFENPLAGPVGG
jgi:predicted nucleic acid-binding protein